MRPGDKGDKQKDCKEREKRTKMQAEGKVLTVKVKIRGCLN